MDIPPETALIVAIGGPLTYKLLGRTADYIGGEVKNVTETGINNMKKIFTIAVNKLGDMIEKPGDVPPRVIKGILQEGWFCDDELMAEYFGGVLASSRSDISRDDRGSAMISLVSRLTTYQIRSHYIFYLLFKKLFDGESLIPTIADDCEKMRIFISWNAYCQAMDFSKGENADVIISHVVWGLTKEQLIGGYFATGDVEVLKKAWSKADEAGIILYPSALGVELFLWAYGKGRLSVGSYLDHNIKFELMTEIDIATGYKRAV